MPPGVSCRYRLPHHVFLCALQDGVAFLDVRRDRYFGLSVKHSRALESLVEGWPGSRTPALAAAPGAVRAEEEGERVAALLARSGLLTTHWELGKSSAPHRLEHRAADALGVGTEYDYGVRAAHLRVFVSSWLRVRAMLRFAPFETIVRRVRSLKDPATSGSKPPGVAELREKVSQFRRIKPFVFSSRDQCLLHSLVLVHFLAHWRIFPTWVIGITTDPFLAHAWVQHEEYVLDSTPAEVAHFTPILTV